MKKSAAVAKMLEMHNKLFTLENYDLYSEFELCQMLLDGLERESIIVPYGYWKGTWETGMAVQEWEPER